MGASVYLPTFKEYVNTFFDIIKSETKIRSDFAAFKNTSIYERFILNSTQFASAKSVAQNKMLKELLFDSNGVRKNYSAFKKDAKAVTDVFNTTWLRTEYDLGVRCAASGEMFRGFKENADIYPMWVYLQTTSSNPRIEHLELVGNIYRIGDPDGDSVFPPGGWNCFDKETEIYTKRGYIKFENLTENDVVFTLDPKSKQPEWQKPIKCIKQIHKGEMINIEANNFSCLVTPNHSMLVYKSGDRHKKNNHLKLIEAKDIKGDDKIYKTINWISDHKKTILIGSKEWDCHAFSKFMAWYLSEGSVTKRGENYYQISIKQEKKEYWEILKSDLKETPLRLGIGKNNITINDVELGKYLMCFGKSHEKYIPSEIKELSKECLELFIDRYVKGDGHIQKGKINENGYLRKDIQVLFSSSELMIHDLSELVMKIGKSCTKAIHYKKGKEVKHHNGIYSSNYDMHKLTISLNNYFTVQKKHIKTIEYNDFVYCVEVPKYHTLLVSRRGKIYWSGNCSCGAEQIDQQYLDENNTNPRTSEQASEDLQNHVDPQFRFDPSISGILPKSGHSYFQALPSANDADGSTFGITDISAQKTKLSAKGMHQLVELFHTWKIKYHSNGIDEVTFQCEPLLTNITFNHKSLVAIAKHANGTDQLADTITAPSEVWSRWVDVDTQQNVIRCYIKGNYAVETFNGVITDAYLVNNINRFRKGVIIY